MNHKHYIEDQEMLDKIFKMCAEDGLRFEIHIYHRLGMSAQTWATLKNAPNSSILETIRRGTIAWEDKVYGLHKGILTGYMKATPTFVLDEKKRIDRKHGEVDQVVEHKTTESKFDNLSPDDLESQIDNHVTH